MILQLKREGVPSLGDYGSYLLHLRTLSEEYSDESTPTVTSYCSDLSVQLLG